MVIGAGLRVTAASPPRVMARQNSAAVHTLHAPRLPWWIGMLAAIAFPARL
jgi:hypothetical protein